MSTVTIRSESVPISPRQRRESHVSHSYLSSQHIEDQERPRYIKTSPYDELEHQFDLSSVDTASRLLAQALIMLEPSTPHYAITKYDEAFNWPATFSTLRNLSAAEAFRFPQKEFYVIEFRSRLKDENKIDNNLLFRLDKESHREANAAGGLLKYWYGSPDSQRRNLATCLWRHRSDAIEGGKGPWHKQARGIIAEMYESIDVIILKLTIEENAISWKFEPWSFH